jgi:glutamine cyclotransferase
MLSRLSIASLCLTLATACSLPHGTLETSPRLPEKILRRYDVVNSWPHDPRAFTQGLVFSNGFLYESTGFHGASSLRLVDPGTGMVLKSVAIPDHYFAEGITILNGKIYQLTWQEGKGFIYDQATLEKIGEFCFQGEGWGITDDGQDLIMSDGTNVLRFLDPVTFRPLRSIRVLDHGVPLKNLNELEYIRGEIYAIVWTTDRLARIDPRTGTVREQIDLSGLFPVEKRPHEEADLNGIAYDRKQDRIFVTGKFWPRLYEIRLRE